MVQLKKKKKKNDLSKPTKKLILCFAFFETTQFLC